MHERNKGRGIVGLFIIWMFVFGFLLICVGGCKNQTKLFTVGILNGPPGLKSCVEGFKAGMVELGYIEGKNIRYIYNGSIDTKEEVIDAEIKNLLSQDIDLLFTTGNEVTIRAKKILEGTDMPVVFGASSMVKEQGIISDLSHPGGNITGVQAANSLTKALEWMSIIIPGVKKVYLPYNPDDSLSIVTLEQLNNYKPQKGIELFVQKIHSIEETISTIEKMSDIDAVLRIPCPTLDNRNSELSQIAVKRRLPLVAIYPFDETVLITLGSEISDMGEQAARIVHQIRLGVKPADLPVETAQVYFTINLKTAEKIGVYVPDDILAQAKKIIR